jgi:hypothetical protein
VSDAGTKRRGKRNREDKETINKYRPGPIAAEMSYLAQSSIPGPAEGLAEGPAIGPTGFQIRWHGLSLMILVISKRGQILK